MIRRSGSLAFSVPSRLHFCRHCSQRRVKSGPVDVHAETDSLTIARGGLVSLASRASDRARAKRRRVKSTAPAHHLHIAAAGSTPFRETAIGIASLAAAARPGTLEARFPRRSLLIIVASPRPPARFWLAEPDSTSLPALQYHRRPKIMNAPKTAWPLEDAYMLPSPTS